jgi:hypothetical protein
MLSTIGFRDSQTVGFKVIEAGMRTNAGQWRMQWITIHKSVSTSSATILARSLLQTLDLAVAFRESCSATTLIWLVGFDMVFSPEAV